MSRARMVAVAGAIAAVGGLGAATVGVLGPLPAASAGGAGVTITVDTFDDEWTEDGDCSLREALFSANRDSAFDECAAGDGPDTIVLPAGTYVLSLPDGPNGADVELDLDVQDAVTLRGAGASTTTIDADGIDRVISAQDDLVVEGLTITGGVNDDPGPGGGIQTSGMLLEIRDSVITGNETPGSGGGIAFEPQLRRDTFAPSGELAIGELVVVDSTISDNTGGGEGGGVFVNGDRHTVEFTRSTVSGNTAGAGGGIHIDDQNDLTIDDSTISGNTATGEEPDFEPMPSIRRQQQEFCGLAGGGLNQEEPTEAGDGFVGSTEITNSTFSGNTSVLCPGGGMHVGVDTTLTNVTVVGNSAPSGANIYVLNFESDITPGVLTLANTIVADGDGGDCEVEGDDPVSAGGNIDTDGSCGLDDASDQTVDDVGLGALAANGGTTLTHLPQAGSPAIDLALAEACPTADQRGVTRPQDGDDDGTTACDVGAVEVVPASTPTTEPDDGVDSTTATPATPTVARPNFTG